MHETMNAIKPIDETFKQMTVIAYVSVKVQVMWQ